MRSAFTAARSRYGRQTGPTCARWRRSGSTPWTSWVPIQADRLRTGATRRISTPAAGTKTTGRPGTPRSNRPRGCHRSQGPAPGPGLHRREDSHSVAERGGPTPETTRWPAPHTEAVRAAAGHARAQAPARGPRGAPPRCGRRRASCGAGGHDELRPQSRLGRRARSGRARARRTASTASLWWGRTFMPVFPFCPEQRSGCFRWRCRPDWQAGVPGSGWSRC